MNNGAFRPFPGAEHRPFLLEGGSGAALLIHGFPGTPAEMRPLADALYQNGWTVHGPLLPGFGPELESLAEKTANDWYHAVQTAYQQLRQRYQPVLLIGNSMGGALTLRLCAELRQQAPDGLVLMSPFWRIDHPLWDMLPVLRRVFPTIKPFRLIKPDFSREEMRAGVRKFLPDADLDDPQVQAVVREFTLPIRMFAEIRRAGEAAFRAAPKTTVRTLILQGSQDTLVKPDATQRLAARLGGIVQLRKFPAGHDLFKPELPAWNGVKHAVLEFSRTFWP